MRKIFIIILILSIDGLTVNFNSETIKIMPFVNDASYCIKCHKNSQFPEPAKACKTYCSTCHKENNTNHHITDVPLKQKRDFPFELTRRNKITCRTCHDLKTGRHASSPWKAVSLYESIFSKKKKHKTYYLILKNDKGQLCKNCH